MNDDCTMPKIAAHDWSRADAMTDAEVHRAACDDPDAQPLTEERLAGMRRLPQSRTIRRALGLSQEEFAARYWIDVGTIQDWEQGRARPDQTARAYLQAIAGDPKAVQKALETRHRGATPD